MEIFGKISVTKLRHWQLQTAAAKLTLCFVIADGMRCADWLDSI